MPYSYARYVVNSGYVSDPDFAYGTIELLSANNLTHAEQLVVKLNGEILTLTTDYTVDEADEEVSIIATIEVGDVVTIERSTKIDARYVDWVNSVTIDASDLDLDANQLFFLIQEIYDQTGNTITLDIVDDCWDAQNKKICNLANGTLPTDAVSLRQLQSAIEGGETAVYDNIGYFEFTGDGSETEYTCTAAGIGYTDAKEFWVWVAGVIQDPGNYSVSASDTPNPIITFDTAPPLGAEIRIRTIYGSIKAIIAGDVIDGSTIAADTIGLAQLNFGAGVADRFLLIDASGDPSLVTMTAARVTNLASTVKAYRLDEFAAPTADLSANGYKITNLAAGTAADDAVRKSQMDSAIAAAVAPLTAASVAAGTVSASGSHTAQSVSLGFAPKWIRLTYKYAGLGTDVEDIFVDDLPVALSVSPRSCTVNTTGTNLTFTFGGSGTGNSVVSYAVIG